MDLTIPVTIEADGSSIARTVQRHVLDKATTQQWPGWWRDEQIAAEFAQQIAAALAAAVSPSLLAEGWLAGQQEAVGVHHRHRRRHRPHEPPAQSPGPAPAGQPQRRQRPVTQRQPSWPNARLYLTMAGVPAALTAALLDVLRQLWQLAWRLGREAVLQVLGAGELAAAWAALDALLAEGQGRLPAIVETRISRLARVLTAALDSGAGADSLAAEITAILGSPAAALAIAQSEVTWASSAAALDAYAGAGIARVRWQTENDSRVCAACRANQAAGSREIGKRFPSGDKFPPAHPRCVLGSTRVAAPGRIVVPADIAERESGDLTPLSPCHGRDGSQVTASAMTEAVEGFGRRNIRAVTDREYVGEIITLRTALGYELSVTPNHPVATRGGWVPAAELTVGDYVLSSTRAEWKAASVDPDVNDIPPCIEDVAKTFPVLFGAVPTSSEDFHGDGAGSDICVIRADGLLVDDGQPGVAHHACEHDLGRGDVSMLSTLALDAESACYEELRSLGLAANGLVGGGYELRASVGSRLLHPDAHSCTATARLDASINEAAADDASVDSEGFCERLLAFSSDVAPDEIVNVKQDVVTTHVYNLEAANGWYIGNGILTHNCRCALLPAPAPVAKSPQTPVVSTVHHPLGTEGLWHTPDRHVGYMQQLPAYAQNIARALMRDHSMNESQAIATAINAIKRWARGDLHWGNRHIHPEVVAAARRALAEWESLRASHK